MDVKRRWSWSSTRRKQWIKGLFRKVRALGGSQRADKMVICGEPLIMRDEVPWGAGTEASPVGGTGETPVPPFTTNFGGANNGSKGYGLD